MIRTARTVNDEKPGHVIERVAGAARRFREPRIACLGLAFKADIDDLRESPAVQIVQHLAGQFPGQVVAVEPNITALPPGLDGEVRLVGVNEAMAQADIVVILVDHSSFRGFDPVRLQSKVVIDTRGLLSRQHGV